MFGFKSESQTDCRIDFTVNEISAAAARLYDASEAVSQSAKSSVDYCSKISENYVELYNSAKEKHKSVTERISEVESELQDIIEEQADITGSENLKGQVGTSVLTGKYSDYHLRAKELNSPVDYHKNERYYELEREREYRERDFRALEDYRRELESIMQQCREANDSVEDIANTVSSAASEACSELSLCLETANTAEKYARAAASAINDIGGGYTDYCSVRVAIDRPASLGETAVRINDACEKMAEATSAELHAVSKSRALLSDDILEAGVRVLQETDRVVNKKYEELRFKAKKLKEASDATKKYLNLSEF